MGNRATSAVVGLLFVFALLCGLPQALVAETLDQAVNQGKVKVDISGLGGSTGDTILVDVQRKVPQTLQLTLIPGTVFKGN